jgi:hypothetical protein
LPYALGQQEPEKKPANEEQKNGALDKKHDSADGWNR